MARELTSTTPAEPGTRRGIDYAGPYMGDVTPFARALQLLREYEGNMAEAAKHGEFGIRQLIEAKERAMAAVDISAYAGPVFMPSEVEGPLTPSTYKQAHDPAALLKARLNHTFKGGK